MSEHFKDVLALVIASVLVTPVWLAIWAVSVGLER
jgi:hypothetical protein